MLQSSAPYPYGHWHFEFTHLPIPLQAAIQGMSRHRTLLLGQWMTPSKPGTETSPPVNGHSTDTGGSKATEIV
ncbi:MAG: hypothetical protein V2I33_18565, partial [Kangiellaceae bacterium]|nr:hypothetical protein [Kangiellaceae bacterium]